MAGRPRARRVPSLPAQLLFLSPWALSSVREDERGSSRYEVLVEARVDVDRRWCFHVGTPAVCKPSVDDDNMPVAPCALHSRVGACQICFPRSVLLDGLSRQLDRWYELVD